MCVVERLWVLLLFYLITITTILIKNRNNNITINNNTNAAGPPLIPFHHLLTRGIVGMFAWVDLDSQGLNKILHQTKSTDH